MEDALDTPAAPPGARPILRRIADLPGPRAWPLVGNLLQLKATRIHQDVERWCRIHGTLFRLRFGRTQVLVVADHKLVAAILRDRPAGFRRPAITSRISEEMGGPPGLFLAEGDAWRNQRRMVMAGFTPHAIKAYFPALVTVAQRLQRRWEAAAKAGHAIELTDDLKRYTVDIIAGLAFGTEVNTIDGGEDVIQRHMDVILPAVARRSFAPIPYWRYFKLPADRRLDRSIAALRSAIDTLIAAARARMAQEPARRERPSNLLEAMISAADQGGSGVDDQAVAGNVSTMLLAGEDTTANALAWMLYLLHRHPEAMRRAQEEVRRIAPDPAAFCIEQMDALDYLDACAQEAMRLKPVAPFLPLEALRDTMVADVHLPKGGLVWCVLRHDSVDDAYFPNAAQFAPQRWLERGEASAEKSIGIASAEERTGTVSANKGVGVPFGAGLRTCPGRYLALLEIKIAMAMLLGRFEVVAVDTPDGKEAAELMGFVMSPLGLRMRLRG
ncbi:cytochrome P450 [Undibacterium sp.]|uniref:cytochrome P450 n=1 Tax=Undibacterium sp. TaxID=1914977 RepID=UPI002BE5E18A|nr:cytochrome P450 [Undibacterium sp.]HTD04446.1 cytochrome P450 [Undibacterium sp.]